MPLLFLSNAPATSHLVKNIFHHLKICSPQLRAGHQQIICFPCQFRIIFYNGSEYRIGWSRVKIQSWKWKNYTTTQKLSTVEASGPNFTFMDKHRFLHSSLQRCEAAIKQKNVYFYPVKDDKPSCTLRTQKCYPFFSQHVDIVNRQNDCNCCWYNITDPKVISILNDRGVFKLFSSTNPHAPRQFSNRYRSFNTPIIENCVKEPCERMALVWVSHKYRDAFASFTGDASRSVTLSVIQRFRGQTQMEPIFWAKHNTLSSAQAADCKRWYIIEFSKCNRKPGAWKRTGPIVRSSV